MLPETLEPWNIGILAYSNWNILSTDTRSNKFIDTACMVSIYDRKYDVIFKYVEIKSSGQNSHELPQPQQTSEHVLHWN